ncbi:hypothetical protein E0Z10_g4920 [Xylaria hypoxylon]|uniref:Adenylate kinase active site lid domain-containing protein n=1 Tax=Xylaria hypoxylon TaxID=37992 RepID=A0A4Z0YJZ6_9PEZI|nr:hypothetical protein E0Z10_g4920 [Xylaria hypoxylon]
MESTMQSPNDVIIFVLGPPGSGKGTVCKTAAGILQSHSRHYCHLSVGDYLRELCNTETPSEATHFDRNRIRNHLRDNILLPADVLTPILKHRINSTPNEEGATTVWLIDGFPRSLETAPAFEKEIGKPVKVITLECSREVAARRFLSRGREKVDDDKRFSKRYDEYVENMKPIDEYYKDIMVVARADGDQRQCLDQFLEALPPVSRD